MIIKKILLFPFAIIYFLVTEIRNNLFPHNRLQERTAHFSTFVSDSGIHNFTAELKTTLSNAENGLAVIQI